MDFKKVLRMREPIDSREGVLTVLAMLMMLYVIAMFFSIAIHEILGHGLFTVLLGGEFYAVYVSPSNGFASLWLPQTMGTTGIVLVYMAGIIMQLAIGAATLFLVIPRIKNFLGGLFALMFCIGMLVHSSMYLFMGYYYKNGDTFYAVRLAGIRPDPFLVAGLILTGAFVLLISMAAMRFMGRFMNLDEEGAKAKALTLFWFPPLLLSGIIILYSLSLPKTEQAYPLLNSTILLLFIGMALFLVPIFSEPKRDSEYHIRMKSVFTVAICFIILMASWAGIFGLSRETAHGLMLHEPPIEAEKYYRDYTVGNVDIMVYSNGTARVEIVLRNMMESPSPLESQIYRTFDRRPDWDRYIERSRNMLAAMFTLPREVAGNLTFSTDYGTARYLGTVDELGRKCMTYVSLADAGTRQHHMAPGHLTFQPGTGTDTGYMGLYFRDPWATQNGYLDEVRVSWEEGVEEVEIFAWNDKIANIPYNLDGIDGRMVGWENTNLDNSPSEYWFRFRAL